MEVAFTDPPPLSSKESETLNLHSVLNILNVIQGQFYFLGDCLADDLEFFKKSLSICKGFQGKIQSSGIRPNFAQLVEEFQESLLRTMMERLSDIGEDESNSEVREALQNLDSVFEVFKERSRELVERFDVGLEWKPISITQLEQNFAEIFQAIEKNSKGRYHIVYNLARQLPDDYLVKVDFDSTNGKTIRMPPVFQDVMRDLIANSRKYTPQGGRITAGVWDNGSSLRFVVEDNGKGIPQAELSKVTDYGYRATNVRTERTMGGGFGLTKARTVVSQFQGKLNIWSVEGEGTKITIQIPIPERYR